MDEERKEPNIAIRRRTINLVLEMTHDIMHKNSTQKCTYQSKPIIILSLIIIIIHIAIQFHHYYNRHRQIIMYELTNCQHQQYLLKIGIF